MANYKEVFPQHALLPVVHVETEKQALRNTYTAYKEKADGVFLISMSGMPYEELLQVQEIVRREFGSWFVGVNLLDLPAMNTFDKLNAGVSGLWTDNAGVRENSGTQITADAIDTARNMSGWRGLYFGSVAFKYQPQVADVARAAKIATEYVDVVTTSGDRTGEPPTLEKIVKMKSAIGAHPLGISSGISVENVGQFMPYTDCFLVASSLLEPGTENFDDLKMRDLVQAIRS